MSIFPPADSQTNSSPFKLGKATMLPTHIKSFSQMLTFQPLLKPFRWSPLPNSYQSAGDGALRG